MLADILEYIQGRKISKRDLKQLPQEKKLAEIRRNFVKKGGPIGKAAVGITEGGGTALFRVGKNLKGSKINKMTAQAMRVIWNDEKQHYLVQAKEAAGIVKTSNDMKIMKSAIVDVSLQRVWMRNEMFMEPMAKKEIENFLARRR